MDRLEGSRKRERMGGVSIFRRLAPLLQQCYVWDKYKLQDDDVCWQLFSSYPR